MRVMTWNVLEGGGDRFEGIVARIAEVAPDVLALQECLGWESGDRLARVASAMGVPVDPRHALLGTARPRGSGRRYHVALLSRTPTRDVRVHNDPAHLGHCLIEVLLGSTHVVAAHFDSHDEDARLKEARYLGTLIDGRFADEWLLMGDLNAISPRDPYPPDLERMLRHAGTEKYGLPPRFDVVRELERQGWHDALRARPDDARWVTAPRDRGNVHIDYRTDYVFVSPALLSRLSGAHVIEVGASSDHHAVLATFA